MAAENLAAYILEQKEETGTLPTDKAITIERFRDELGDWRICILTPFGARIHAPWAIALQRLLGDASGFEIQVMYTDDGIVLRFADVDELPPRDALIPDPDEIEELVIPDDLAVALAENEERVRSIESDLVAARREAESAEAERDEARHSVADLTRRFEEEQQARRAAEEAAAVERETGTPLSVVGEILAPERGRWLALEDGREVDAEQTGDEYWRRATLLPDGRVFVTGGFDALTVPPSQRT
mgnify:CR=1 FL=1